MSIETTTALRKISALTKKIWCLQGSQGAGKTFSIVLLILNHASRVENREMYVSSAELSKMHDTVIKDALKIINLLGINDDVTITNRNHGKTLIKFPNGSFVKFLGLDKEDIGKGLRCHLMFVNEANKIKFETYRELTSRAEHVILDYNPNSEFYAHTEIIPRDDCDYLKLTYLDNEELSQNEINEILYNKKKAYFNPDLPDDIIDKPENIKSKYWLNKWHVYGLGIVGTNPNRIFFWNRCTLEKYNSLNVSVYYGVDWGAVDPFAIVECKYYDGQLYVKELNYLSENQIRERLTVEQNKRLNQQDEGLVKWLFSKFSIDRNRPIICDSNRPEKIRALRQMGYGYALSAKKGKGSILSGIDLLSGLDVYYTHESKNIEKEQANYSRKVDRYGVVLEDPQDEDNHLCDSIRYVSQFLLSEGIIKNI